MNNATEAIDRIQTRLTELRHVKGQGSRRVRLPVTDPNGNVVASRKGMSHGHVNVDPADVVALTSAIAPAARTTIVRDLHLGNAKHVDADGNSSPPFDEVWIKSDDAFHLLDQYKAAANAPTIA